MFIISETKKELALSVLALGLSSFQMLIHKAILSQASDEAGLRWSPNSQFLQEQGRCGINTWKAAKWKPGATAQNVTCQIV